MRPQQAVVLGTGLPAPHRAPELRFRTSAPDKYIFMINFAGFLCTTYFKPKRITLF